MGDNDQDGVNSSFDYHEDIFTWLSKEAFDVHGIPFNCKDIIQSLLYISPFCYSIIQNQFNPSNINSFMITINPDDEVVVLTPGRQNRLRPSGAMVSNPGQYLNNTVMVHKETGAMTFNVTVGFLFDNFHHSKPKAENDGKFILEQTGDLIVFKQDLEQLMSGAKGE